MLQFIGKVPSWASSNSYSISLGKKKSSAIHKQQSANSNMKICLIWSLQMLWQPVDCSRGLWGTTVTCRYTRRRNKTWVFSTSSRCKMTTFSSISSLILTDLNLPRVSIKITPYSTCYIRLDYQNRGAGIKRRIAEAVSTKICPTSSQTSLDRCLKRARSRT